MTSISEETSNDAKVCATLSRLLDLSLQLAKQPFRLLDLPNELWIEIGKLAIDEHPIEHRPWEAPRGYSDKATLQHRNGQPAITRVCRILRQELMPYYHKHKIHCVVRYRHQNNDWPQAWHWLKHIDSTARRRLGPVIVVSKAPCGRAKCAFCRLRGRRLERSMEVCSKDELTLSHVEPSSVLQQKWFAFLLRNKDEAREITFLN